MSHSKKDGRRRGGHRDHQCTEFWSRRCPKVNGWRLGWFGKFITHRWERRQARREAVSALRAALQAETR